ncbi:MAG: hypothetical protein EOP15_01875 [Pseudomonas sp.]|nr:MAG: hypothetical protein EOP15_01875 [Pseudomonas sp.]
MTKQAINLGTAPAGAGGDDRRSAWTKAIANFNELYDWLSGVSGGTTLPTALPVAKGGTGATTPANARTALQLGDAATKNVGVSAGQVMGVGAGGLLGSAASSTNLHNVSNTEFRSSAIGSNSPPGAAGYYNLINIRAGVDTRWTTVLAQEVNGYRLAFKTVAVDQSSASTWSVVYHTNNTTRAADGTLKAI